MNRGLERLGRGIMARRGGGPLGVGIMTGAVAGVTACPASIVLGHWDSHTENGGLSKDARGGINYGRALAVAERQIRRELCRVVRRASKQASKRSVLSAWFSSQARSRHWTSAAPRERGGASR